MIKAVVIYLLSFFDYFHQLKIIKFLKNKGFDTFELFFDVGAHKGETIKLFLRNFKVNKIYSFEPSPINFANLKKEVENFKKKFILSNIIIENIALGNETNQKKINHFTESSSSTLKEIDREANYFKKKLKILNISKNNKLVDIFKIQVLKSSEFLIKNNISKINFLKIDTEGYEYEVLLGFDKKISCIEIIMFEHHYDNMLKKNYTFSEINSFLEKNNFKMVYKSKMPFRKTFEYIYFNQSIC